MAYATAETESENDRDGNVDRAARIVGPVTSTEIPIFETEHYLPLLLRNVRRSDTTTTL